MDILSKLRILFWGLVIGLWGLFMYQYMAEDMSMKRFHIKNNPFASLPSPLKIAKKTAGPVTPYVPPEKPETTVVSTTMPSGSMLKPTGGDIIKDIAGSEMMPEHSAAEKAEFGGAEGKEYPETPAGFTSKVTRHFVLYEEGPEVSKEVEDTVENLHGDIMLDLVAFSPWTREKKVFIFYAKSQETYRRLTGRPAWSGGAASLSERRIYLYKSDEAFGILAHELTHMYFDSFFTPSNPSPLWLSEGVATYIQSERGKSTPTWLLDNLKLLENGNGFKMADLVRIENLQGADEDNVRLWYAQSYSIARFLIKMKTGESFYLFCKSLRDGSPTAQALYRAYGAPYNRLTSLEFAWRYDLKTGQLSKIR